MDREMPLPPPKKLLLPWGSRPSPITCFLSALESTPHPKQDLDRFRRFCTVDGCDQQTQTDRQTY